MTIFGPSLQGLNNNTASLADQGCSLEVRQCQQGEISYNQVSDRCQSSIQGSSCQSGTNNLVEEAQNTYTTWFGS